MQTVEFDLESAHLDSGAHDSFAEGYCAMELASFLAGEAHSDHPKCVSPVLGAFLRNWNDSVDDAFRQKLKPFIPRVLNTAEDGKDEVRAWMATDWLARVCAPVWLDLAKLTQHAMALRTAERIQDSSGAKRVQPIINAAQSASAAARAAAKAAASTTARARKPLRASCRLTVSRSPLACTGYGYQLARSASGLSAIVGRRALNLCGQ